jgi:hypothetical protein
MSSQIATTLGTSGLQQAGTSEVAKENVAVAFTYAAVITILFNTALAWIKDSFAPLNSFMASLTGHHWRTHGLADVILFVVLGLLLMRVGAPRQVTNGLIAAVVAAVVLGGGGLAAWFLFV